MRSCEGLSGRGRIRQRNAKLAFSEIILVPFSLCAASSEQLYLCQSYVESYIVEGLRVSIRCSKERSRSHPDGIPTPPFRRSRRFFPFLRFPSPPSRNTVALTLPSHSLTPRLSQLKPTSTPSRALPHHALDRSDELAPFRTRLADRRVRRHMRLHPSLVQRKAEDTRIPRARQPHFARDGPASPPAGPDGQLGDETRSGIR